MLDAGGDLASARTRYRLLAAVGELPERRNQRWSWDITKLRGAAKWTSDPRSVIRDVVSRYVGGWLVAARRIGASLPPQGVTPGTLTLHADRGSSMRSQPVALRLADLGVAKTHTRPYTASDTPYAEAQCKTLEYRPGCPRRCGSLEDARACCQAFFRWYTHAHRQAGSRLMTPAAVPAGRAPPLYAARAAVLQAASAATPERFVRRPPTPPNLPTAAWINPPKPNDKEPEMGQYLRPFRVSPSLTGSRTCVYDSATSKLCAETCLQTRR